jgi:tight adherence protein C
MNLILSLAFMGAACVLAALAYYALASRRSVVVERRLRELAPGDGAAAAATPKAGPLTRILVFAATLAPESLKGRGLREQLAGAGLYGLESIPAFIGSKIVGAFVAALLGYEAGVVLRTTPAQQGLFLLIGLAVGFQAPSIWVWAKASRRREAIRLALPDALDLLVVCVEAGLGLNAALVRVGRELRWNCPALSEELALVNQEMRAGLARNVALRNFAARVPIPDIQSLVAMFVQTDRLGTSIARSLRVHADSLRQKRRQRAEERARAATIKLIFPLVFFIFPELLVVILGPAGIRLWNTLREVVER